MQHLRDPLCMPGTGERPKELLSKSLPLTDTLGKNYVEKRGIPCAIANAAGVRFDPNFDGKPRGSTTETP
jgi:hypothetical protein